MQLPCPFLFWKRCRRIDWGSCLFTKHQRSYHTLVSKHNLYFETPCSPWSWMIIAMANFITLKTLFTYPWQLIKQYKHELITVATSSPLSITDLWPGPSNLTPIHVCAACPPAWFLTPPTSIAIVLHWYHFVVK